MRAPPRAPRAPASRWRPAGGDGAARGTRAGTSGLGGRGTFQTLGLRRRPPRRCWWEKGQRGFYEFTKGPRVGDGLC